MAAPMDEGAGGGGHSMTRSPPARQYRCNGRYLFDLYRVCHLSESAADAAAESRHRSDCSHRNQRRDQRIFDCGNAASVLGQPANDPKVQLHLQAGWASVSAPHQDLRDKLDVAEFGASEIGELLTAGVIPPTIGVNQS